MSIQITPPELTELQPRITVMGIGGAGGNAVNNMIRAELTGVSFVVANTDAQALAQAQSEAKIQLGVQCTQGLGAGSRPDIGQQAAEEALDQIDQHLDGCHMLFLTAGMGGGTGTGAIPIIAERAREKGILTVGVVTKPFQFEGAKRSTIAEAGIRELQERVDTLIVIPNQNLFRLATEKTTFQDAFAMADEVLNSGVRGITDLMVNPGLINLDFADVKTVMSEMGKAMMGTGEADGENRAVEAADAAVSNPLLDEVSLGGAQGVIINITGGMDLTLFEVDEAANHIRGQVDADANIIVGSAFDESLNGQMRISVVATGLESEPSQRQPQALREPGRDRDRGDATSASVVSLAGHARAGEQAVSRRQDAGGAGAPPQAQNDAGGEAEVEAAGAAATPFVGESPVQGESEDVEGALEKPLTGEEDEREEAARTEALSAVHNDDAFIAPEPKMPERANAPAGEADAFAEAAFDNGARRTAAEEQAAAGEPAGDGEGRGKSLFERMTALGGRAGAGAKKKDHAGDGPAGASASEAETAPKSGFGRLSPEDRPVPTEPAEAEEQLEIPAFLRRQAT